MVHRSAIRVGQERQSGCSVAVRGRAHCRHFVRVDGCEERVAWFRVYASGSLPGNSVNQTLAGSASGLTEIDNCRFNAFGRLIVKSVRSGPERKPEDQLSRRLASSLMDARQKSPVEGFTRIATHKVLPPTDLKWSPDSRYLHAGFVHGRGLFGSALLCFHL